jgi:hypothetical protein
VAESKSTQSKSGAAAQKQSTDDGNGGNGGEGPLTIPVSQLISDGSALLGHPPHVVAGAMHGTTEDEMGIEDAKRAVEEWLKQPVETDEGERT